MIDFSATPDPVPVERRKVVEHAKLQTARRSYDPQTGYEVVKIFSGDWHVSTEPGEMLATILGSCVSACIRDPIIGVGGMNHFLLPGDPSGKQTGEGARYGVNAMESLINGILKAGGRKDRLEVKVFGGGNVINNSAAIGSKNAVFIRDFLKREGFRIVSEDLEGDLPRRVHYFPDTGKVLMRRLKRKDDLRVVEEEIQYQNRITAAPVEGDIDLF
jgi:chemotaxis protein CheD